MITVPGMVLIGGNCRNSGKTTMACHIISHISSSHEVIGLKVTSVRNGEMDKHGNHDEGFPTEYSIFEELNREPSKDTSLMLRAGATHVYYIKVSDIFIEQAVLHFLSRYINKQIVVCESRSLRNYIIPGLFLMMIRLPAPNEEKDVSDYLPKSDKIFYFDDGIATIKQFADNLQFENGRFVFIR